MSWPLSPFALVAFIFTAIFLLIYVLLIAFQGKANDATIMAQRIMLVGFAFFVFLATPTIFPELWILLGAIVWPILITTFLILFLVLLFYLALAKRQLAFHTKLLDLGFQGSNLYYLFIGLVFMYRAVSVTYDGLKQQSEFTITESPVIIFSWFASIVLFYLSTIKTIFTERAVFSDFGLTYWENITSYEWVSDKKLILTMKNKSFLYFNNKVNISIPKKHKSAVQDLLSQKLK